ncbi:hypothetical protein [Halostella sp. PRR32]|uniref:phage terminase large subunit family protein n=1 Tax=Halostella sp. PRR32 TaxID=3098147 RepID=UPI002B1D10F6|nr:hypothetical protein [Halostella sp. PRR32]
MSSTTDPESLADVATGRDPAGKRETLNPFDGPATLLDAANELCRGYMDQERDGYHLLDEHHGEWLRLLDEHRKLVLNCHRDGLKTTTTLAYLILRLEYDPGFKAIWAMNNQGMATEKADTEFNRMVERNPWLVELNKGRRRDTVKKKEFANGSTLKATWLDGGIDGDRAHLLVLDDLIKAKGDGDPKDVREWIEGTAVPMVKDDGRQVFLGTRKRSDDIYAHYRGLPAYTVAEYPAILEYWEDANVTDNSLDTRRPPTEYYTEVPDPWTGGETMQVLWPSARGTEWLAEKRDEMADFRFWREYCLAFIGGSGNLVEADDVNVDVEQGGCSIRNRDPPRKYRAGTGEAIVVAHDPANSPTGDNCAFVAFLRRRNGERVLLDARAEPGLSPSEVKGQLVEYDRRYDPAMIVIESNGMQGYIVEDAIEFDAQLRAKVTGLPTSEEKHSWENGIPRLRTLVENGGIQFYRGHEPTEDFITALQSLELDNGKLEGHTPDLIAACYMAEKGLRRFDVPDEDDVDDTGGDSDQDTDGGVYSL